MAGAKTKTAVQNDIAIGLGANARREVASCLAQLLAGSYVLQVKTQYYHWNITGAHFAALHTLFEGQYDALAQAVDEIAERIRALGHVAPGTMREFLAASEVKEDKSLPAGWEDMVANLAAANEMIASQTRELLTRVQKAGDEGSADLFIRRMQEHEKAAWMLRSHLQ